MVEIVSRVLSQKRWFHVSGTFLFGVIQDLVVLVNWFAFGVDHSGWKTCHIVEFVLIVNDSSDPFHLLVHFFQVSLCPFVEISVIGQFILFIWRYQWNRCNFLPKGIILPLCQILAQRWFYYHLAIATTEVDHSDFLYLFLLFYQIIVGCLSSCKPSVWNTKTLWVVALNFAKSKLVLWLDDLIVVNFSRIKVFF